MGLEFGEDLQRAVGPAGDLPPDFAREHAARGGERPLGAGVNQVRDGLGLREIDAAGGCRGGDDGLGGGHRMA